MHDKTSDIDLVDKTGSNHGIKILVVDDESHWLKTFHRILESEKYSILSAQDSTSALAIVESGDIDLIIADLTLPDIDGIDLMRQVKHIYPDMDYIIVTGHGSIKTAVTAIKEGADDYITKPFDREQLLLSVDRTIEHRRLKKQLKNLQEQLSDRFGMENIVGRSKAMIKLFRTARKVADSEATILIQGESGTGKELLAKAIHYNSRRREKPLVTVDCASLPPHLLQSELFGHVKGAFTGAVSSRRGLFEESRDGTIFLDEIGDISPSMQLSLLRVLQEGEIRPVGSDKVAKVNTRVIAATNKPLQEAVAAGEFRRDLYYRLAVITLKIPPLRERIEDIPELGQFFLEKYNERNKKAVKSISPSAMNHLLSYRWEGNVRELENVIERAIVLAEGDIITLDLLPAEMISGAGGIHSEEYSAPQNNDIGIDSADFSDDAVSALKKEGRSLWEISQQASSESEKGAIEEALRKTAGNKSRAAKLLKISRGALYQKLREYQIDM
ncbi:sigma-54-dependent Fis family transcriptional regulator [bacterium]|nr:sigma-54-dependent Fis family transcriptional regulator [bacterium]